MDGINLDAIVIGQDGRVVLTDEDLVSIERDGMVAGGSYGGDSAKKNPSACNGINQRECINTGNCSGSVNTAYCSNSRAC